MCSIEAAIITSAVVGATSSIYQGNQMAKIDKMNRERAQREAEIQNAQLKEERRLSKVNAQIEENNRRNALERNLSSVRAYNRGKNSKSFDAFLSAERDAFRLDVENLRLGSRMQDNRLATQISVNTSRASLPDMSGYYKTTGYLNAAGSLASGASNYYMVQKPNNPQVNTQSSPSGGYGNYQTSTASGTSSWYQTRKPY